MIIHPFFGIFTTYFYLYHCIYSKDTTCPRKLGVPPQGSSSVTLVLNPQN